MTTLTDTAPARAPRVLGRCRRCFVRMARRGHCPDWLCSSCAAAERATDQAARAERAVRAQLYRPGGNVDPLGPVKFA